jgi:ankyrin repeat protein
MMKSKPYAVPLFQCVLWVLFFTCASALTQSRESHTESAASWKPIFDGKTLSGWKATMPGYFSVEDGAITGEVKSRIDRPESKVSYQVGTESDSVPHKAAPMLIWEGEPLEHFRLRFKCRLQGRMAASGIHFRARFDGQNLFEGYQADIYNGPKGLLGKRPFEEYASPGQSNLIDGDGVKTVSYFKAQRQAEEGLDFKDWTEYQITARGQYILIEIKGRKILELIDQRLVPSAGVLALSLYPFSDMRVQLKEIKIQPLKLGPDDRKALRDLAETIQLVEFIKTLLVKGDFEQSLALLKQNPHITHYISGMKTNAKYSGGSPDSFLHAASRSGATNVVEWLIANGVDINQESTNNALAIHSAKNAKTARLLIAAGANLKAQTSYGDTPLQVAASDKRLEVVDVILQSGFPMDIVSAIRLSRHDLVEKIIQTDLASINRPYYEDWKGKGGETPLMQAVRYGELKITQLLLQSGADVNAQYGLLFMSGPPHCGNVTALSIAVVSRKLDFIELLLQHEANPKAECTNESLIEYARKYRSPEIVALLEKEWPKKDR